MRARRPLVDQVSGELRQAGAVAVVGPTGFGKSAVLDAVCTGWRSSGDPVVRLSSAPADAHLPYVPLVDLFTVCPPDVSRELSDVQRSTIDWVLRRVTGPEPDPAILRVTVLSCLQRWGSRARLLLAADDMHWWGPDSLDVFGFAARRSRGSVSLLAALRPDGPLPHDVLGGDAVEIAVPTLSPQESAAVVRSYGIPLRTAGRIHTATGGNPRLVSDIAAGLARAGATAVLDAQPLALHVRKALRAWLAGLAAPVHWVLLLAALAADPSVDAVRRAAGPSADAALADAEAVGLIRVAGTVRFPAPVVREGILAEASGEAVRQAHLALAAAASEDDDRVWHEASALTPAELPARLVPALADAATAARASGDHTRAAEFGLLAGGRPDSSRHDLLVAAARDAETAGRLDLACTALEQLDRGRAAPAARAQARLAVVDAASRGAALVEHVAAQALADATAADEPTLVSAAHLRLARGLQLHRGCHAEALAHARSAAERAGDVATHASALALIAQIEQGRGAPGHAATLRRALAAGTAAGSGRIPAEPRRIAVGFALLEDRLDEAGRLLDEMRPPDCPADRLWLLGSAVRIHAHRGEGPIARDEAHRLLALTRDLGASPGPPWYAAAVAELAGGTLEQALAYADLGLTASQEDRDTVFAAHCLHLSGMTRLLLRETDGALADLLRVRDLVQDLGIADPAEVRYEADLAEALVAAGDLPAALRTITDARRRAEELGRRGVLAALDRAEALYRTAKGEFGPAEDLLDRALCTFDRLGYPLQCGRVLLAHASVEQRRRRPARARELQAAADAVFLRAGAPLWEPARPERARARAWPAGLTDAERRIAELVTEGHGNRDIAAALYVSVKTVEAALTRIYRKLEVRSRVQLMALVQKDAHPAHR